MSLHCNGRWALAQSVVLLFLDVVLSWTGEPVPLLAVCVCEYFSFECADLLAFLFVSSSVNLLPSGHVIEIAWRSVLGSFFDFGHSVICFVFAFFHHGTLWLWIHLRVVLRL